MKEKKEEEEKHKKEREEDVARTAAAQRAQDETNKHNSMLLKILFTKLNVESTATPETSVETFSFPFKSDENGSNVLTMPTGQQDKGIPSETNGIAASPASTVTRSTTHETNSTNSSLQLAKNTTPPKITPLKTNNTARKDTSKTSASKKTRNEMESEETPDHLTGKRTEPGTPTKGATRTSLQVVRGRKQKQNHG